jgi:uncharacterized membrane protein
MTTNPSTGAIVFAILGTLPGILVLIGILIGFGVLFIPFMLPETHGWREVETRVVQLDWGISAAALLIGIGVLLVELRGYGVGFYYGNRYRYGLSGLFFYIALRRVYSRISS